MSFALLLAACCCWIVSSAAADVGDVGDDDESGTVNSEAMRDKMFEISTRAGLRVTVRYNDAFVGIAVSLRGQPFLNEAHVSSATLHHANQWFAPGQGMMLVEAKVDDARRRLSLRWVSELHLRLEWITSVRYLDDSDDAIVFRQEFVAPLDNATLPGDERRFERPCTQWPSFAFAPRVAALWWNGMFDAGSFSRTPAHDYSGGIGQGGVPLVLYDAASLDSIVLSPATSFKSSTLGNHRGVLVAGVGGTFLAVPRGHVVETVLVARPRSVVGALMAWGDVLLARGGKRRTRHDASVLATLGYLTDNGAMYHTHPEPNCSYAETLVRLKAWCVAHGVPLRYVQLDSWWYEWDARDHGVDRWRPRRDAVTFPDGELPDLGVPYQLHNRFFSRSTRLAERFEFALSEPERSKRPMAFLKRVGTQQYDLYAEWMRRGARHYHMAVYEQDWLQPQVFDMPYPMEVLGDADAWLEAMNRAALENGVEIMYCMPNRADYLMSTRLAAVQSVRVSRDYANWLILRLPTWHIFVTSVLAEALGLMVIKDTFWSVERQPGFYNSRRADRAAEDDHGVNASEPNPGLMALIATLSAGQVAPGDRIGSMDVALIMRTCNANGTLLRPDRPAFPTRDFFARVPSSADEFVRNVVSHTTSTVPGLASPAIHVLAINVGQDRLVALADLEIADSAGGGGSSWLASRVGRTGGDWSISYESDNNEWIQFDAEHPLRLAAQRRRPGASAYDLQFEHWFLAPPVAGSCVGNGRWYVLGERATKFVPVSRDRFTSFAVDSTTCRLTMRLIAFREEQIDLQAAFVRDARAPARLHRQTMTLDAAAFERRFGDQWIEIQVNFEP